MVRLTNPEIDVEMLAHRIIDSAFEGSRPDHKSSSVSIPKGTLPSSILVGALKRRKHAPLPIIVLEIDSNLLEPNCRKFWYN